MSKDKTKKWKMIFLVYIIILIRLIIFKYPLHQLLEITRGWEKGVVLEGLTTANFTLGKSIRMYIRYFNRFPFWNGFANLIGNVLVFIPYGILLPLSYSMCRKWWRVFYCAIGLVIGIELFQLFSAFGVFDVDDILLNVSGAMLGYGIYALGRKAKIRYKAGKYFRMWKKKTKKDTIKRI